MPTQHSTPRDYIKMAKFSEHARDTRVICKDIAISASAGSHAVNVFKLHGAVRVLDQAAEITSVTTLTNCTAVYATLYDGTNTENLTANGAVLSNMPVGTVFSKEGTIAAAYTVLDASQRQVDEEATSIWVGKPFTIVQKNGVDTYVRLHLTTTDDPVSFSIFLRFEYQALDGGYLEILV